jgi:phage gp29-like protein
MVENNQIVMADGVLGPDTPDSIPITLQNTSIGSYGSISYGGYPAEDYLMQMRGRPRADVFDQMRRGDTQIKMCLSAVKNPLKGANWEIQAADDSPEAEADKELIEHILFHDMGISWIDFVGEALTCIEYGHAVFEIIHKAVINHAKFGSYNGIKKLAFRGQRTLERWNLDEITGELKSVTQVAYGDLRRMVDIPAEHLLIFSLEKEGANYEGISMIRPCYGSWYRKNHYLKYNAAGIEKFAIPTPLVEVPEGKASSKEFANLIQALGDYLSHQKNYLAYPQGWKITLNTSAYDPAKVEISVDKEDERMTRAFLANFLNLGSGGGGGSYALSNDLSDFFLSGIEHIAYKICDQINLKLIPSLIMMNRGQREAYPELLVSGIADKAGIEFAQILQALSGSKIIIPDEKLEEHVRNRFDLPQATLEGQRLMTPPTPQAPPTLAERIKLAEARRQKLLSSLQKNNHC